MLTIFSLPHNKCFTILLAITAALIVFSPYRSQAQKRANRWALGTYELDFNSGSPIVKKEFATHLIRGMGVISDDNGALLFYTDGYSVWNKDHALMANGSNLMPSYQSPSTQESIIIPKPGSSNIFFIFSVDPWNGQTSAGLYYSEVDLSLNGGLGAVTTKGIRLVTNTSNKISAALHTNGKDVWVTTHKHNSNRYYFLLVTENGISSEIRQQDIGKVHGSSFSGQLKFSPDSKKVAVSYGDNTAGLSLFDFDAATGVLSNAMDFSFYDLDSSPYIEGLEFSSDAKKIYTFEGRYDRIYQFDISLSSYEEILASRYPLKAGILYNLLRHFQLAPDGKIYITKGGGGGGTQHLGVIDNPNAHGPHVKFRENGLFLEGGSSFVNSTPNFIQNYFFKTNFVFDHTCAETTINFQITNQSRLDSAKWFFGEGTTSDAIAPDFKYASPGTYNVKLLAYYPEKTDTITHSITINPVPSLDLGESKSICYGNEFSVDDVYASYKWAAGDTIHSIKIKEDGWYKLTVKNEFGCSSTDSVFMTVLDLPVINLPDTLALGELESLELTVGTFDSIAWSTGESSPSVLVKKAGWYSALVENSDGCQSARSVFVKGHQQAAPEQESKWKLLNPMPSNSTGRDAYFLNDMTGFIINGSQLLHTKDGGNTWKIFMKISSGRRIAFKNFIGYIIGDYGAIYKSTHFGDGWNKLPFAFTDDLNAITVIHQDTLRVTSDNRLFLSNDGGRSWVTRQVNGVDIEDSFFTGSKVGHVACQDGTILKTTDGGITWYATETTNTFPSDFYRITFVNENVGFASQAHSDILKTTDGGESWTLLPFYPDASYSMQFLNEKIGFIAGDHGAIHKTKDGGATWQWIGFDGRRYGNNLYSVFFINEYIGFATGLRGRIIKTQDGGKTWKEHAPTYNMIGQIAFTSENIGYVRAGNEIFKTTNKGTDWIKLGAPLKDQHTRQFDFINDETGFAIAGGTVGTSGNSGQVYKTTDGGKTWSRAHSVFELMMENIYSIDFVDEKLGFASGGYNWGAVLKTVDGGVNWKTVGSYSFGQIQFVNSQIGYARNINNYYDRIYKTTDSGETWQLTFETETDIAAFDFVNESVGYAIGDYGKFYKTVDGGTSWQELKAPYEFYRDVKFFSADFGYILDEEGALFRTRDGGQTWEKIHQLYGLYSIELNDLDIYLAGDNGLIITSQNSYNDLIQISDLSVASITDSSALVRVSVRSHLPLQNAIPQIQFGLQTRTYDRTAELGALNGFTSTLIQHEFTDLQPSTRYYFQAKILAGDKVVASPELSFMTPPKEIISSIDHENADEQMRAFPNPANTIIRVDSNGTSQHFTFEIRNITGQLLMGGESAYGEQIDISRLKPGAYILSIQHGANRYARKIVKQ